VEPDDQRLLERLLRGRRARRQRELASAPIIVAAGEPVVTIGGFGGRDPAPTVEQVEQMVADGELRYVLLGDGRGPGGGDSDVSAWVQAHGTAVTGVETGDQTLYEVAA
jgi:hypothetical protein